MKNQIGRIGWKERYVVGARIMVKFIEWNGKPEYSPIDFVNFQDEAEKLEMFKIFSTYISKSSDKNCNLNSLFEYFDVDYIVTNMDYGFHKRILQIAYQDTTYICNKDEIISLVNHPELKKKIEVWNLFHK